MVRCKGTTKLGEQCKNADNKCRYHGSGIQDLYKKYAPAILQPSGDYTQGFRKYLKTEGGDQIVRIQVGRKPINSKIKKVLNVLSLGKFGKTEKRLGEDALHSYLLITTKDRNGKLKQKKIERNHTIEVKNPSGDDYNDLTDLKINHDIDVRTLINNAKNNDPEFAHYDASHRNCQVFVKDVIDHNKALTIPGEAARKAIEPQNSTELIKSLGQLEPVAKFSTDIANVGHHLKDLLTGGKKKKYYTI